MLRLRRDERPRQIWILEGGYCADIEVDGKTAEKMQWHAVLRELLMEYGYNVHGIPA